MALFTRIMLIAPLVMACSTTSAIGQNVVAFTGTGYNGDEWAAITNGDLYQFNYNAKTWAFSCNVFTAAGVTAADRSIVGIIGPGSCPGINVLASDGTVMLGHNNCIWAEVLNIPESSGTVVEADPFVAFGGIGSNCDQLVYAATKNGQTFLAAGANSKWTYIGNVFGGPTPARRSTLGNLKRFYR